MITFKQQFDKLTEAYIHNKVEPYDNCACFVGNLLNRDEKWQGIRKYNIGGKSFLRDLSDVFMDDDYGLTPLLETGMKVVNHHSEGFYTAEDILSLENTFLRTLEDKLVNAGVPRSCVGSAIVRCFHPYEDALFEAFQATLNLLREIHTAKGEQVDDFIFQKRVKHEQTNLQGAV